MTHHREWWQQALELALIVVMSFGFGSIVVAVRGPRRVRMSVEQRKRLGVFGAVVFVASIAAWMETEEARKPLARPAPSAAVPGDSVSERAFESAAPPAVKVDAPEGWHVAFDPATRRLSVLEGEVDAPRTLMVVFTRQLEAGGSPATVRAEVKKQLEAGGLAPIELEETIDGRPALGLVAVSKEAATGSWSVDRGGGLVSVVQCRAAPDRDARTACRAVLDRLRWVTPAR